MNWHQVGSLFNCSSNPQAYCNITSNKSGFVISGQRFCHVWGPDISPLINEDRFLTFSSVVVPKNQRCPQAYNDNAKVYIARAVRGSKPLYFKFDNIPTPIATSLDCPNRMDKPMSILNKDRKYSDGNILKNIYIDNSIFQDKLGQPWLLYTWNTNLYKYPNFNELERKFYGVHTALVKLDETNPTHIKCENNNPIPLANPKGDMIITKLKTSCVRCKGMLSLRGHVDTAVHKDNFAVAEGGSQFFHNGRYYMLFSGSSWTSQYYNVYWVSATSILGLRDNNKDRLMGRYLIPSAGHGFGHGHPIKDKNKWYYLYHHLDDRCRKFGYCARDTAISPIEFTADGRIKSILPAEELGISKTILQNIEVFKPFEAQIQDANSGLCVTVHGKFKDVDGFDRSNVKLIKCQGLESQIFWFDPVEWDNNFIGKKYYQIKTRSEVTCLTVNGASKENEANIMSYPCVDQRYGFNNATLGNQYFKFYKIINYAQMELGHSKIKKQCLTVQHASKNEGANMIQYECIDWSKNNARDSQHPKNALFNLKSF